MPNLIVSLPLPPDLIGNVVEPAADLLSSTQPIPLSTSEGVPLSSLPEEIQRKLMDGESVQLKDIQGAISGSEMPLRKAAAG